MKPVMLPRRALIFLFATWTLVMLYPDPGMLVRSVRNVSRPAIDPQAVASLATALPDDPRAIEAHVLAREVPYSYDWQAVCVPWYFPTTAEALRAGRGDCESRAVVLASVLTAKGIPNELRVSIGHIWVDYPGKQATASENPGVQIAGTQNGRFFLRWPADFKLGREVSEQLAIHWTPAPPERLLLLVAGVSLIVIWNALARLLGAGRLAVDGLLPDVGRAQCRRGLPGRRGRRTAAHARGRSGPLARPYRA
jgi:hypothetical protein